MDQPKNQGPTFILVVVIFTLWLAIGMLMSRFEKLEKQVKALQEDVANLYNH